MCRYIHLSFIVLLNFWYWPFTQSLSGQDTAAIVIPDITDAAANLMDDYAFERLYLEGPGIAVARSSGNIHDPLYIRLRGINTLQLNADPLYVVDGMPGFPIQYLRPERIASIKVLKNISAASKYGIKGGKGVIEVTLKDSLANQLSLEFGTKLSTISKYPDVMDAAAYRIIGGKDLGTSNNVMRDISRNALSPFFLLQGFQMIKGHGMYFHVNGHRRKNAITSVAADLLDLGLEIQGSPGNGNLSYGIGVDYTDRHDQDVNRNIFRYAAIFNPTSPLRNSDGSFFEESIFDYVNPLGIIENSRNERNSQIWTPRAHLQYAFRDDLLFKVQYSGYFTEADAIDSTYNSSDYIYRHITQQSNEEAHMLSVSGKWILHAFELDFGYDFYEKTIDLKSSDRFLSPTPFVRTLDEQDKFREIGFYLSPHFETGISKTHLQLRYEGSTRLGKNERWSVFYGISESLALHKWLGSENKWQLEVGYGRAGNVPDQASLFKEQFDVSGTLLYNGNYIDTYSLTRNANPGLKNESTSEWYVSTQKNLGKAWSFDMTYYNRKNLDMIWLYTVPMPPNLAGQSYLNGPKLKTSGWEWSATWQKAWQKSNLRITANWHLINRTKVLTMQPDDLSLFWTGPLYTGQPGAPGAGFSPTIIFEEGGTIGQQWGPQFRSYTQDEILIVDTNRDGFQDFELDSTPLGQALPSVETSWLGHWQSSRWDIALSLTGSFGHQIFNNFRSKHEFRRVAQTYNVTNGIRDVSDNYNGSPRITSLFFEDAGFLRVNHLDIRYSLPDRSIFSKAKTVLGIGAQNLLTFTSYTGIDPEVRWQDTGQYTESISMGVDRRHTQYFERSFYLSLSIQM